MSRRNWVEQVGRVAAATALFVAAIVIHGVHPYLHTRRRHEPHARVPSGCGGDRPAYCTPAADGSQPAQCASAVSSCPLCSFLAAFHPHPSETCHAEGVRGRWRTGRPPAQPAPARLAALGLASPRAPPSLAS